MANNATLISGTTFTTAATGFGECLNLDGSNKGATLPLAALAFSSGGSFTIRVRVKTSDTSHTMNAIGLISQSDVQTDIFLGAINGTASAVVRGINSHNAFGSASISDNAWHTLTLTVNGSGAVLYVDGTSNATPSGSYTPGTASSAHLGKWTTSSVSWIGLVDEAAIYTAVLSGSGNLNPTSPTSNTDTNLRSLYHCNSGNVSSLTMLDCAGSSFSASPTSGGNGQSITFTGTGTQWTTVAPAFTISGSSNSIGSQSVTNATSSSGILAATTTGSQTITDSSNNATFSFTVTSVQTLEITGPTYGLTGVASTTFTITASANVSGNTSVTLDDGASGTFTPSSPTILDGTSTITFTYTPNGAGLFDIVASATGHTDSEAFSYRSYTSNRTKLAVAADYGEDYTGEAEAIGFVIYSTVDGSILLPHTLGETSEISGEDGFYVAAPYVEPTWAGVLIWDRPSGALRISQTFN